MSLYIGNLSPRTQKDELERVFQKFGRCDVRMKDGYGFVVYEFPPNAGKALKALQKKYICGQSLTLTWSNKQPKPFNRHGGRPFRRYDSQRGGFSARGSGYGFGQEDYRMPDKHEDDRERRLHSDMFDEGTAFNDDDRTDFFGQEHHSYREDEMVENDRWDLQFRNPPNENGDSDGIGFDRYEPYQDRSDDGNRQLGHSSGSPSQRSFRGDIRRDHIGEGNLKHKDACYSCGGRGHKMRNCPEKSFMRRKWSKFNQTGDNNMHRRGKNEDDMERSRSKETPGSGRELVRRDRGKNDVKLSSSRKYHTLAKENSSPIEKEVGTFHIKDHERKKRSRKESGSPKSRSTKRGRRSVSSPPDSGDTGSRSVPKSSKHLGKSHAHSRSRSISSRAHSLSSDSRSGSTSHRFRNTKLRSRSISPASLSLSVSLGRPLTSPNKVQLNLNGSTNAVKPAISREVVVEKEQVVEADTKADNSELANEVTVANSGSPVLSLDMEGEVRKGKPLLEDNDEILSAPPNVVIDPSTALQEEGTSIAMSASPKRLMDVALENSDPVISKNVPWSITKPESELPVVSGTSNSTEISSEELSLVLKHYGLDLADEDERHLSPEAYFGSARLWPWEVIYYRRWKKGPISTENYARRVEQNHKFGIVDKYIRSSSGWGELDQGNE